MNAANEDLAEAGRGTRPIVWLLFVALGVALMTSSVRRTVSRPRSRAPRVRQPGPPSFAEQLSDVRSRPVTTAPKPHSGNGHAHESGPPTDRTDVP